MNQEITNTNDFKVVSFHNSEDFAFTPELGCMFDGKPIHGMTGQSGIASGEKKTLPYHVAHQLAVNLAKAAMIRKAPATDPAGIPTGVPLWDGKSFTNLKNSYLTDLYTEDRPAPQSESQRLIAKVEELTKFVQENITPKGESVLVEKSDTPKVYLDKAEVIAELEKRGIQHDKRQNKDTLEKLLA